MEELFHPIVGDWFAARFGAATEPQAEAWPLIRSGRHVLISAPTGSGKTLAAFLICLDDLARSGLAGTLADTIQVVYVSPLKALSNDIHKNLEVPLAGIAALAAGRGLDLPEIRTAVRTGDTPAADRQRMIRQPPHVLVTTPESLFILLTAEKSRSALSQVRTVIVDEIHAMADDKRGAHLALSLARLDDLVEKAGGTRPQRIGLSATVRPIEHVARFLAPDPGAEVAMVDRGHHRRMEIAVEVPRDELGPVASNEMWQEIYDRLAALIRAHRTTLVFVNTRRLAERVAHHLGDRLGEEAVLAHHGSLSRRLRLTAEEQLKTGRIKAVVATASLELGIDIGTVDLVCQIGSPRSIAVALQRIGRSGHQVEQTTTPKGRIFATTRDELIECAALVRSIAAGELDRLLIPAAPLDVLAQQIVAAAAAEDWREDDLFALVRARLLLPGSLPRRNSIRSSACCRTASARDADGAGRSFIATACTAPCGAGAARAWRRSLRAAPSPTARSTSCSPSRTRPWSARWTRISPSRAWRATCSCSARPRGASAAWRPAGCAWRTPRARRPPFRSGGEKPQAARPSCRPPCPTFASRSLGRRRRGGRRVHDGRVRPRSPRRRAGRRCTSEGARAPLGALPSLNTVVAERFFDEGGGMQLVLHSPFGARINRAWGLALRKRFCRSFNFELQAAATDNGIVISLSDQHSFPLELVFRFLTVETVEDVLTQAMLPAPMFEVRWRWDTSRALAVLGSPAAERCRRRSSACAPTTCSPPSSPIRPPARRTSSATSGFRIIPSSTRRSRIACTRRWISRA